MCRPSFLRQECKEYFLNNANPSMFRSQMVQVLSFACYTMFGSATIFCDLRLWIICKKWCHWNQIIFPSLFFLFFFTKIIKIIQHIWSACPVIIRPNSLLWKLTLLSPVLCMVPKLWHAISFHLKHLTVSGLEHLEAHSQRPHFTD